MRNDGIINIYKEKIMTSHDVVGRVRRTLGIRRVGHTGTLDPMAEGVLPVCIGRATRIMDYLDQDHKVYTCTMLLGRRMDTQDIWGTEIGRAPEEQVSAVTEEDVRLAFAPFHGVIRQTPPMYSAVRVDGRRLYEYARAGESVEVKSREICIFGLTIEEMRLGRGYESSITFRVECSKGTYIRAICEEAGERLGVHGAMSELTRTASGVFTIENSLTLDELAQMAPDLPDAAVLEIPCALPNLGELEVRGKDIWRFRNGLAVWGKNCSITRAPRYAEETFPLPMREEYRRAYRVFGKSSDAKVFLGVGMVDQDTKELTADKVFCPQES